jgi:hypothetical protein
MKGLKNFLFTLAVILGLFLSVYIVFAYFLLEVHRDVIFSLNNWENSINKNKPVKLELIENNKHLDTINNKIDIYNSYYIVNFKNSPEDFKVIEKEIEYIYKKNNFENVKKSTTNRVTLYFLWNTYSNIARHIKHPETSDLSFFLALFSVEVVDLQKGIHYTSFAAKRNLNVKNTQYTFEFKDSHTIETSSKSFNFIFWSQAFEFISQKAPDFKNRKISFYNGNNKIAEFDYSNSEMGYKIILP